MSEPQRPGKPDSGTSRVRGGYRGDRRRRIIVAAGIVAREDKILVTKRQPGVHLEGLWEFPGGKVEEAEDPELAVVRECKEECDIDVRVTNILDVTYHRYPSKDVLLLFYDCTWVSGEVQHLEISAHEWIYPVELTRFSLPAPDERVVKKILDRAKRGGAG